jgi:hypothetical protein
MGRLIVPRPNTPGIEVITKPDVAHLVHLLHQALQHLQPHLIFMPKSAEGLALLHNLIKQDAYTLKETSIQRLERHV